MQENNFRFLRWPKLKQSKQWITLHSYCTNILFHNSYPRGIIYNKQFPRRKNPKPNHSVIYHQPRHAPQKNAPFQQFPTGNSPASARTNLVLDATSAIPSAINKQGVKLARPSSLTPRANPSLVSPPPFQLAYVHVHFLFSLSLPKSGVVFSGERSLLLR